MLDFFKLNEKTLISNMKTYKSINLTDKGKYIVIFRVMIVGKLPKI